MRRLRFLLTTALSLFALSSAPAQEPANASTSSSPPEDKQLFDRVISNQKKSDAALDLYERTERVEARKNSGEPHTVEVKITRVVPAGTGMVKIPIGPDGKPADA